MDRRGVAVNIGILAVEVLTTLVRLKRYDHLWLLQPHLSLVWSLQAQNMGCENGCVGPCIDFWSDHCILNTDAMELLALPMQGIPTLLLPYSKEKNPALLRIQGWND